MNSADLLQDSLLLVGGLLGSAHCLGMCGGFVISLGADTPRWTHNLARQLLYAGGRVATYVCAGAIAGFASWKLGHASTQTLVQAQAILSVLAGTLLIFEGGVALGWFPRPRLERVGCPIASFGSLLRSRSASAVFAAGVWNGLLPCGLVYAYLALAASSAHLGRGAWIMLLFGLGTVPALVLVGLSGSLVRLHWRRRVFHLAAWCLLFTGVWTTLRGIGFWKWPPPSEPECPLCGAVNAGWPALSGSPLGSPSA